MGQQASFNFNNLRLWTKILIAVPPKSATDYSVQIRLWFHLQFDVIGMLKDNSITYYKHIIIKNLFQD